MANALYMEDSYLKEFTSSVRSVKDGKFVVLDNTAFYPNSGGQPFDTGKLIRESDGKEFNVVFAGKFGGDISHEVDAEGLKEGDEVRGIIDWDRRYRHMRMHTASHVIAQVFHEDEGALITGNQLAEDRSRVDYALENFDRDKIEAAVDKANRILAEGHDIKTYFLPKDEAMKIPGIVKLAGALPPSVNELRIVEIVDVDIQADGGTHVKNTKECGKIVVLKMENKGKSNRRLYFTLE